MAFLQSNMLSQFPFHRAKKYYRYSQMKKFDIMHGIVKNISLTLFALVKSSHVTIFEYSTGRWGPKKVFDAYYLLVVSPKTLICINKTQLMFINLKTLKIFKQMPGEYKILRDHIRMGETLYMPTDTDLKLTGTLTGTTPGLSYDFLITPNGTSLILGDILMILGKLNCEIQMPDLNFGGMQDFDSDIGIVCMKRIVIMRETKHSVECSQILKFDSYIRNIHVFSDKSVGVALENDICIVVKKLNGLWQEIQREQTGLNSSWMGPELENKQYLMNDREIVSLKTGQVTGKWRFKTFANVALLNGDIAGCSESDDRLTIIY